MRRFSAIAGASTPMLLVGAGRGVAAIIKASAANTAEIYIGDRSVIAAGIGLLPGQAMAVRLAEGEDLYGISTLGGQLVDVLASANSEFGPYGPIEGLGTAGTPAGGVVTVQGAAASGVNAGPIQILANVAAGDNQAPTPLYNSLGTGAMMVMPMLFDAIQASVRQRTPAVFKTLAAVAVTAGTPVAAWTPAAGKKFRFMGGGVSLSVAGAVIFKDATTEIWRTPLMPAGIGQPIPPNFGNGILSAAANNVLNIDVTATGSVTGGVFGTEE